MLTRSRTKTYDSARLKSPAVEEASELLRYLDLLKLLVSKNLKTRYKRSVLGVGWTLLNPLLQMTVLTVAFSQLFRYQISNYAVYVLSGLLLWTFLSQTTTSALNSLVWGSGLLRRVYVPPSVFPVSAIGTGLVNLALSMIPLFAIMIFMHHPIRWTLLLVPASAFLTSLFALGISLILSTIAVVFTDVVDMYNVLLRAWFFLTPIMYPESIFPESMKWLLDLNPVYHLILIWRVPIFDGQVPAFNHYAIATTWSLGMLLFGWWFFARRSHEFAYRA